MKKILISLLITLLGITLYAKPVAHITALQGLADIKRKAQNIKANIGSSIEQKDTIITKDNSKLQLIFEDETIISIGKNSNFSVQEYLFEDNQVPVAKFGMIQGAIRTITGKIGDIAPQKFSVTTKTATIGIRGTNFSIFVDPDGSMQAFCTFGAISATVTGVEHTVNQGYFIQVSPLGKIAIKEFSPNTLKNVKKKYFAVEKPKKNLASINNDATLVKDSSENNEQLNLTTPDSSQLTIADVTETSTDVVQQTTDTTTATTNPPTQQITNNLASIIAGYTNTLEYTGTYTEIGNRYIGGSNALLTVNFGTDTAVLELDDNSPAPIPVFSFFLNPKITGTTVSADVNPDKGSSTTGSMTGTFQEPNGKNVIGSYNVSIGNVKTSGTYDVTAP